MRVEALNHYKTISRTKPVLIALVIMLMSCSGLDPGDLPPDSFLKGTITYLGGIDSWPDTTVYDVLVIAFERQPFTADDVLNSFQNGTVVISELLPDSVESSQYSFRVPSPPRMFEYVVVAMRYGPNFLEDWMMLAVYTVSGDPSKPTPVYVDVGKTVTIDFVVDFENLPPQPIQ